MDKDGVINEFCDLSAVVSDMVYHNVYATDCICGEKGDTDYFSYEEDIMNYIKKAVHDAIAGGN